MKGTKLILVSVDITENKYSPNIDDIILKKLKNTYNQRCYDSCYIVNVNKIVRKSEAIVTDNLQNFISFSVEFEASIIYYEKNEIMTNCVVVNKDENSIIAQTENSSINIINNNDISKVIEIGQKIPVIVLAVIYPKLTKKINILSRIMVPIYSPTMVYKVDNKKMSNEDEKKISRLIEHLQNEQKRVKSLKGDDKKRREFFEVLLYPYQPKRKLASSIKTSPIDSKILKLNTEYYLYTDDLNKNENKICYLNPGEVQKYNNVVNMNKYEILEDILIKQLNYFEAINNLCESYSTFKDIKDLMPFWSLYTKMKKT